MRFVHAMFQRTSFATSSPDSRQLHDKFRAAILFRYDANSSTVGLHDLVNDGKSQPRSALELRLQGFKNFGALLGVQPNSGVRESDAQPEGFFLDAHRQSTAAGHGPQSVVAKIPENLFNLAGVDARAQLVAIKGPHDTKIWTDLGLLFN